MKFQNSSELDKKPTARNCPVCMALEPQVVFCQKFSSYSEDGLMDGFDLAICRKCGAAYADFIPPQSVFDEYYAKMSKYERSQENGQLSTIDAERYGQIADMIAHLVDSSSAIVDVGCATGALLAEFKARGFKNVIGIDPSSACATIGKSLYDVEIRTLPISGLGKIHERFDLVLLIGVLEHLRDVNASLELILRLLKPSGRIYIEVPDATRYANWFSAPYQFFSMEHVNYFSPRSLANLMLRLGFREIIIDRVSRWLSPVAVEPAVAGFFQRDATAKAVQQEFDIETETALRAYIDFSEALELRIHAVIEELVRTQVPLVIWGAGTHTLRMLETSSLAKANILSIIDSNASYHGKRLKGISIISPSEWQDETASILISSHVAEVEIKTHIIDFLGWKNPIICLYQDSPTEIAIRQETLS